MKKTILFQLGLLAMPLLFYHFLDPNLDYLFEDRRPVFQAERLEDIEGAAAGKRVTRPILRQANIHRVERGDTWWGIARKYRVKDSKALARFNNDVPLVPGVEIEIPESLVERP